MKKMVMLSIGQLSVANGSNVQVIISGSSGVNRSGITLTSAFAALNVPTQAWCRFIAAYTTKPAAASRKNEGFTLLRSCCQDLPSSQRSVLLSIEIKQKYKRTIPEHMLEAGSSTDLFRSELISQFSTLTNRS